MGLVKLFTGTAGLNTVVDPVRLPFDPETGVSDLAAAVNVSIDQSGRPNRRTGYRKVYDGDYHSLFCNKGECVVGKGTVLYTVSPDLSIKGIRSGMAGTRIAYAQQGNKIFYTNGIDNGVVAGGISYSWPWQSYVGPETDRHFTPAPIGHHLAWAFGRMFISVDEVLYWSEPHNIQLYDQHKCHLKHSTRIRMIKPVDTGLFISDERSIWFYRGKNPNAFESVTKVADYPAVEWSDAIDYVEASDIGLEESGRCALWVSDEGALLGTPSGRLMNLNKHKIIYPENCRTGAGLLRGYNFIHSMG